MKALIVSLQLIVGDFDGDGKTERLRLTLLPDSVLALVPDKQGMDTFFVHPSMQAKGFLYLRNEGDLNGDGGHEFSYIPDAADYSNINTCFIISLQHGKWTVWYDFEVLETELKLPLITKKDNGRIRIWRYNAEMGEMEHVSVAPDQRIPRLTDIRHGRVFRRKYNSLLDDVDKIFIIMSRYEHGYISPGSFSFVGIHGMLHEFL